MAGLSHRDLRRRAAWSLFFSLFRFCMRSTGHWTEHTTQPLCRREWLRSTNNSRCKGARVPSCHHAPPTLQGPFKVNQGFY